LRKAFKLWSGKKLRNFGWVSSLNIWYIVGASVTFNDNRHGCLPVITVLWVCGSRKTSFEFRHVRSGIRVLLGHTSGNDYTGIIRRAVLQAILWWRPKQWFDYRCRASENLIHFETSLQKKDSHPKAPFKSDFLLSEFESARVSEMQWKFPESETQIQILSESNFMDTKVRSVFEVCVRLFNPLPPSDDVGEQKKIF